MTDNGVTWRTLEKEGCGYGRRVLERVQRLEGSVDEVKGKVDRLTWALVGAAITFGTAALMLALNLIW